MGQNLARSSPVSGLVAIYVRRARLKGNKAVYDKYNVLGYPLFTRAEGTESWRRVEVSAPFLFVFLIFRVTLNMQASIACVLGLVTSHLG